MQVSALSEAGLVITWALAHTALELSGAVALTSGVLTILVWEFTLDSQTQNQTTTYTKLAIEERLEAREGNPPLHLDAVAALDGATAVEQRGLSNSSLRPLILPGEDRTSCLRRVASS